MAVKALKRHSAAGALQCPLLPAGGDDQSVTVVVQCCDGGAKRQPAKGTEPELLLGLWRQRSPLLHIWLLSSVAATVFAPLLVPGQPMLLPALTAGALGFVGPLVHMLSARLAASNALDLHDQVSLVSACSLAASCLNLLAMAVAVLVAWFSGTDGGSGEWRCLLVFSLNCWQNGVTAVGIMHSLSGLLPASQ